MFDKLEKLTTVSYSSAKTERHLEKMESAAFDFVVQQSPYRVAGKMVDKGHRILYNPDERKEEALYIPNGFPFTNLWLDINGTLFRGLNHYTISNAGCSYIFGVVHHGYRKAPKSFVCTKQKEGNSETIEIKAKTEDFKFFDYTGKPGDTPISLAEKFGVMAYMIIEYNGIVKGFTDNCDGLALKIPSHYGTTLSLKVDAKHGMPVKVEVHDQKGLVERFQYSNYKFGFSLPADFFTESYQDGLD